MELHRLFLPPLTAPGEVVTFYSYKGGTGRTMALSNIAVLLAKRQNATVPVLMVDWDMEAPGLHHYFGQHEERPGVLEFFEACRAQLELFGAADGQADDTELARRVLDAIDWQQYVVRVDQSSPLYLMRAGRFDATYNDRLAAMHWDKLFHSCPALFRCFAANLARHFRYVLVDSRTGRTDSAGICTTLLPKKLVVVFTPNRQSLEGVDALVTRAIEYRRSHEDEQRQLLVYPLPSRIEMGDGEQRAEWRRGDPQKAIFGFQPMFERLLRSSYGLSHIAMDSYFDEVQLQQTKTFAYGEQLAVRIDQGGDRFSLTRTFEAFLQWLTGDFFPWQSSREIHLLAAIDEARRALDEVPSRTVALPMARDLTRLGELYRKEGKAVQALASFKHSLEIRRQVLGEEHIDTLASKGGLARMLRQMDKLDEAQFIEEDVVEARERLLGRDHPDTLSAKSNLASTLLARGDHLGALVLQDTVLDAYMRQLGTEHLLTLGALASRAATFARMGQQEQARSQFETVVAVRERLLGAEHPDTLSSKHALSQTLAAQNDLAGARRLLDTVARAQERRLGIDHTQTLAAWDALGEILTRQGDWPAVRQLHENLVTARGRSRGFDHPETLMSQRNLAQALVQDGELAAARSVQEQVVQVHQRLLGDDHLDTLHSKKQLAGTLQRQGEQDAARVLEDAVLSASDRLLNGHSSSGLDAMPHDGLIHNGLNYHGLAQHDGVPHGGMVHGALLPHGLAPDRLTHDWQLRRARSLQETILAARASSRAVEQPEALANMISQVQELMDAEQYRQARDLADRLREPLLKPGVAGKLRKRGMALLKKMYKMEGDKDALVSLQEDEVSALEGALSQARVANR
ncbi:tetratricopeptide repeat protein [Janthinobacterium agaricidamnosum]|uniref:Tetratricopeptide repeat family protein n=1 Tax=Janthinobacterium agaricidamnosum NBRC 102515 = DSM 9628 TaxID=1349767 RepID=W0VA02_9BURK|nr:tetratricopeptide repeat protein [Janthinobacterium agaricidamnosum]CDG84092.1 tetratricopeptide repeat family protein [Janthinobacterium agaricidamnosum NBRC 102515 = DSM 9628]